MSVRTQIDRISTAVQNAHLKVIEKGGTSAAPYLVANLPDAINTIPEATEPTMQSKTVSPSTSDQTVKPDSGYDGLSQVTVNAMPTATQATPSISVSTAGLITATATQDAGYVVAGTKSATNQLTTQAAQTITPGTSNKTIASGRYLTGTQTIKGDANLVAENIRSGVSIFGVDGSYEGSAGGNFYATEVTLASNYSTQSYKEICTIPFLAENVNNDNLFVILLLKDSVATSYSIPVVMGCNSPYLIGSYALGIKKTSYGTSVSIKTSTDTDYKLTTGRTTPTIARVYVTASGGVRICPETSYSFVAGTYSVIYGIL